MMARMIAMISAMKIRLSVTTAPAQALPCAGMAAGVIRKNTLVTVMFTVLTAPMNLIFIPIAHFAQKRALCPAQVFLGIVQRCATAGPRAQTDGMSFFPLVHHIYLLRPILLFAVRRPASIRAKTDPVVFVVGRLAIMSQIAQMGATKTLMLARISVSCTPIGCLSTVATMAVAFG